MARVDFEGGGVVRIADGRRAPRLTSSWLSFSLSLPLAPFLNALPGAAARYASTGLALKFAHHQVGRRAVFC
jgi:hypothetical protein